MDPTRDVVRDLVDGIDVFDDVEARHRADVLAWIDRGEPLWRTAKPATPPRHLVSYAVLVDPVAPAILLVDHRLAGKWLPTGGHIDPGEHPADAAARELTEELGIDPLPLEPFGRRPVFLTTSTARDVGTTASHIDVSLWFAFTGSTADRLVPDPREFAGIRWWALDQIAHGPGTRFDPNLPRFVAKLGSRRRRNEVSSRETDR